MLGTLKNRSLIAVSYGIYSALIVFFFDSFSFVNPAPASVLGYVSLIGFVSLVEFVLLELVRVQMLNGKNFRGLFVSSFHISGLVASCCCWLMFHGEESSWFLFITTFLVSALLPAMIVVLYFIFNEAKLKISTKEILVEEKSEIEYVPLFCLESETGKTLLKLPIDQLICFEANDNYVIIYYFDKSNNVKKMMERFSLKKMEEILSLENTKFERVHKSFLINPSRLIAISGKAQAYKLELQGLESLIPVSRSYSINLLEQKLIEKN